MAPRVHTDVSTRAFVVLLKSPLIGRSSKQIHLDLGIPVRTIDAIYSRAIERGFEPNANPLQIRDEYLQDAPRSGRPSKQTDQTKELIITQVRRDRYGREKTCADIAGELSQQGIEISATTVWRVLRADGFRKTKPTRKPGLTPKMKADRLAFCRRHEHWTLEDWKNVIWSDETSVVLCHRRGSYRIWRKADEAVLKSCIRERWKGYSEFMFWGCFTYDKKGPCHIWEPETAQEKKQAGKDIEEWNTLLESELRDEWELNTPMSRLGLRSRPGPRPEWKWDQKHGKLVRGKGGGIDWYRYLTKVLLPKLFPFTKECAITRPDTVVQEDKAPSHSHHYQQRVYDIYSVQRLLWCGNSPDLNAIEPAWPYLKRVTTKKGAPKSRKEGIQVWQKAWEELPQEKIQAWIEAIPVHIQKIIDLKGGNEYIEGRNTRSKERQRRREERQRLELRQTTQEAGWETDS
jgi:hypothetical protein